MRRARVLFLVLSVAGCASAPSGPPIEIVPAMYQLDQSLLDVTEGDIISLEFPPQGGHVLFVGARLRNLRESLVTLRARLRHPGDQTIVGEEARTIEFLPSDADPGLAIPDLRSHSNVCNVPMCPSYTALDLFDQPYLLEIEATELESGRVATLQRPVVPSCVQSDPSKRAFCQCECTANYVLGKCSM